MSESTKFVEYLTFKRNIYPFIVQIFFWIGVFAMIVSGFVKVIGGSVWSGLGIIFLGPLIARVATEFTLLFFRMNDILLDIRDINRQHMKAATGDTSASNETTTTGAQVSEDKAPVRDDNADISPDAV